jgi:hypothetical protein
MGEGKKKPALAYLASAGLALVTLSVSSWHYVMWTRSPWRLLDRGAGIDQPAVMFSGMAACIIALVTVIAIAAVTLIYRHGRYSRLTAGALVTTCVLLVISVGLLARAVLGTMAT